MQVLTLYVQKKVQRRPNFLIPIFHYQVILKSMQCNDQGWTDLMI